MTELISTWKRPNNNTPPDGAVCVLLVMGEVQSHTYEYDEESRQFTSRVNNNTVWELFEVTKFFVIPTEML